jgi:hypothetical protein
MRTSLGILALALCTAAHAVPINVDFGAVTNVPHRNVGAIDAGVNVIKMGNFTASGSYDLSSITFSVPFGVQVDKITVAYLSYETMGGASLAGNLVAPNSGNIVGFTISPPLNTEFAFLNLSITDTSVVTASFKVNEGPAGGRVGYYHAFRIYASTTPPTNAPDAGSTAVLFGLAMLGLPLLRRAARVRLAS